MQHDLRLFLFSSLCTCGGKYLSNDNLASQLLLQLTKGVWYKQLTAVSVQILSVQIYQYKFSCVMHIESITIRLGLQCSFGDIGKLITSFALNGHFCWKIQLIKFIYRLTNPTIMALPGVKYFTVTLNPKQLPEEVLLVLEFS